MKLLTNLLTAATSLQSFLGIVGVEPLPPIHPSSQLRLALAGDYDMAVSWNTDIRHQVTKGGNKNPQVCYGICPRHLDSCIDAYSETYPTSHTWNHHVKLSPLEPGTIYYYKIAGDDDHKTLRHFKTPPKRGIKDKKEWSFAFVADLGTMGKFGLGYHDDGDGWALDPGEENTITALVDELDSYDFLWQAGDMGYADYWLKAQLNDYFPNTTVEDGIELYEKILNLYYEQMAPITSRKPFMVGPGNHEANCNNGGRGKYTSDMCVEGQTNFTGYRAHYRMPWRESGGRENMWYSFDYGNVHFIQFDTETDLGNGLAGPEEEEGSSGVIAGPFGKYQNEQIDWLKQDLENVDRSITPWVIGAGHRPWYVAAKKKDVCSECQEAFEEILYQGEVDLCMFGHVHNYQNIMPTYNNTVDDKGLNNPDFPWYILNGAAGHYDGRDEIKLKKAPEGYQRGIDDVYGWSRVIVHNKTHLTHQFIESDTNKVIDAHTLYKRR